ncbi:hypothetical protein GW915_03580 [bacterium]|nr:hypothetical protein [bacterium]
MKSKQVLVNASSFEPEVYSRPSVAIIGTRHPSAWGKMSTRWLVSKLAPLKVNIVSGGAMGIDACAHWAALEQGLSTQAWVVGPNLRPSPRSNSQLFQRISSQSGCAIFTPEALEPHGNSKPLKYHWIMRNAWLVAASDVVVVIEANEKSGTWASAKIAADLGIDVYALPGSSKNPQSQGTNKMISMGYALSLDLNQILTNCSLDALLHSSYNLKVETKSSWSLEEDKNVAEKAQFLPISIEERLRSPEGLSIDQCFQASEWSEQIAKLLAKGELDLAGNKLFRRG